MKSKNSILTEKEKIEEARKFLSEFETAEFKKAEKDLFDHLESWRKKNSGYFWKVVGKFDGNALIAGLTVSKSTVSE